MAIIEGTGIKAAGTEAQKKAVQQKKEVKTAGIKSFLQKKVNEQLNKYTEEGKTPFGTSIGGSAVGEEGMGSFVNPKEVSMNKSNFFSPGGGAFDKRNNVKLASSDLSNLKVDSEDSTFGSSFTKQASDNLADSSIYKQKEDSVYRDTTDTYKDFKSIYKGDSTEDTVKSIEKFYNLNPKGVTYIPRDESKFDGEVLKSSFPGKEDKIISTKEKITGVTDFGYMPGDQLYGTFKKQEGGLGIGVALDPNKYGLVPRPGGLGGMYSGDDVTQTYVKAMMQNKSDVLKNEELNRIDRIKNPQNYNEDGELKTLDQKYGSFLNTIDNENERFAKQQGYSSYAEYQKAREDFSAKIDAKFNDNPFFGRNTTGEVLTESKYSMMPSMTISKEGQKLAKKNRLEKAKGEKKESNILQKVGNFLGAVTNKALGIQSVEASQIGGPLPNTTQAPTTVDTVQKQTIASLPSDYKETEAKAFAAAEAYQKAKNNPNVKAGVDNKGQVSIKPADNTAKAKAQAAAFQRKASGKSISSVKAANKAKMKASAAARHSAFKKTGKSTVSARRAAAKKSMQAKAKARHKAFKKRRKKKSKKK